MPTRSKMKFKTVRAAWRDIAKSTRLKPNRFKAKHTISQWVWVRK